MFALLGGSIQALRAKAALRPEAQSICRLFYRAGASIDLCDFTTPDPSLDAETLSRFASGGLYAQHLAARHPNTNPDSLRGFLVSLRPSLRALAAQNPSSPKEIIHNLQKIGASDDLSEIEAPDEDATEEDFMEVEKLGPFGELLAMLMRRIEL